MSEQDQYSQRVQDLAKIAVSCVSRWGVVLDPATISDNPGMRLKTALRQAAAKALEFEFVQVYSDDHSWSGGSLRGVSRRRVAEISEDPYAVDSDIYGVVAIARAGNQGIVIPLVTGEVLGLPPAFCCISECQFGHPKGLLLVTMNKSCD